MDLKTILYVSKCLVAPADAARAIGDIVTVARARNAELDITGVLIFTEARFAQVLEGPAPAVDQLMASIMRDERHEQVTVARDAPIVDRRFPDWSLAYSGPSLYVDRHVSPLLEPVIGARDRRERTDRLFYLLEELARAMA